MSKVKDLITAPFRGSKKATTSKTVPQTGRRGRGLPGRSGIKEGGSYLVEDTTRMERMRRELEQQGHRRKAMVNARHHSEENQVSVEEDKEVSLQAHPFLNQRHDGQAVTRDQLIKLENEIRDQNREKQLRLGNMPQFSNSPKPRPGG